MLKRSLIELRSSLHLEMVCRYRFFHDINACEKKIRETEYHFRVIEGMRIRVKLTQIRIRLSRKKIGSRSDPRKTIGPKKI